MSMSTRYRWAVLVPAAALAALAYVGFNQATAEQGETVTVNHAVFNEDGTVRRPDNWRSWVFIGANVTPNALNDGQSLFPEFHNTYIEPSAYEHYRRTGEFADGTQLIKELVLTQTADEENGSKATIAGRGYFSGEFKALALEYKDSKRFADRPGGWAYFVFGDQGPPYADAAGALPDEACAACHTAAIETDYVFTQFYPILLNRESDYAPRQGR